MWRLEEVAMPLSLISTNPTNGASDIDINIPIQVFFNQGVISEDLSLITIKNSEGETVSNIVASVEDNVIVITHDALVLKLNILLKFSRTINGYETSLSWTFTTKAGQRLSLRHT